MVSDRQNVQNGEKIGAVYMGVVMNSFSAYGEARRQLEAFAHGKDALIVAEGDAAKRQQMLETGRREYAEEERRVMVPVFAAVNKAITSVAKANGVSTVLNAEIVFWGAFDLTSEVIKELNKANAD